METEYELTFEDFQHANALYMRKSPLQRILFISFNCIIYGYAFTFIFFWFYGRAHGNSPTHAANLLKNFEPILAIALIMPFLRRLRLRRTFNNLLPKSRSKIVRFSFSNEGVTYGSSDRGEGHYLWSGLTRFLENEKVALLFTSKITFIMVPKRAYTEDTWAQFKKIAAERIKAI